MAVHVRDAATVMLVRDGSGDDRTGPVVEVCMLRRNLASEFVAGAYVFPGGSVDPEDRSPAAEALCRGRTDAGASAVLGVTGGGLGFWVAALRECFEEAGVLLAVHGDAVEGHDLLDTSASETEARFGAYRAALNEGRLSFLGMCRQEDLRLAVDAVHFVSHWITPELAPRRYDTRFFIAAAPPGQVVSHDDGETIAAIWVRPSDALDRHAAGEIDLLPPTVANLQAIRGFATTGEVMTWARDVTEVPVVLPIVVVEDDRALVLRPGDAGYEEALADRLASGSDAGPELEAAARWAWGAKPGA